MGYFDGFPKDDLERLAEYRKRRMAWESSLGYAKRRASEAKFKRDLGLELTQADENYIAFTPAPWGTAPSCHHP